MAGGCLAFAQGRKLLLHLGLGLGLLICLIALDHLGHLWHQNQC